MDVSLSDARARLQELEEERDRKKKKRRAARKAHFNSQCFRDAKGKTQRNNWHHLKWFHLAEQNDRLLVEAAREHAKTQVFGITQPLYEIFDNPNVRILIVSDIFPKAEERTKVLKEHIANNEDIARYMGRDVKIVSKKGDGEFTVDRDFYWLKEPTVRSTYAGGPVAGGRYDIIIADDLVNYLANANTEGKRHRLSRWWNDEIENSLAEGGRIWVIGTHQHHADLYEEIKRSPLYKVSLYPAVDEEDTGYGHLGYEQMNRVYSGIEGDDAKCLWPQAHNYERLMAKKNNPSTHDSYLRQQQQLAVPETGLVYRKALMDAAFERGHSVEYDPHATQFVGLDPGYAKRAAMLCIQERVGDRVDLWREHSFTQMNDEDISGHVVDHCVEYDVQAVYVDAEDVGLIATLIRDLEGAGAVTEVVAVPFNKWKLLGIRASRWMLQSDRVAWKGANTTVHTPGRTWVEESIFRREVSAYALQEGEEEKPQKGDDHGPDAWTCYAVRWIDAWITATGETLEV